MLGGLQDYVRRGDVQTVHSLRRGVAEALRPMSDFLPVLRVLGAMLTFFSLGMFVPWIISWTHADGLRHVCAISAPVIVCGPRYPS